MPRKYAANQPIFSQAGVMWPWRRHVLRMENRCVGEASCLEWLTLNPLWLISTCSRHGAAHLSAQGFSTGRFPRNTFPPCSHDTSMCLPFLPKVSAICKPSWPCPGLPNSHWTLNIPLSGFIGLFYHVSLVSSNSPCCYFG